MKTFVGGLCAVFAVGSFGCSAADFEEPIAQAQAAINVGSWNNLVAMSSTGSYTLTADINAAGKTWTPKAFYGTFDGNNKTISNLTINGGSFFSGLENATVKNVKFTNLTLTGVYFGPWGGIAGWSNDSTISNTAVELSINLSSSGTYGTAVGGLIGAMSGGSIYRSYAKGTISGFMFGAGGLVGRTTDGELGKATISESYAQVTVNPDTSNASLLVYAGGVVGSGYGPNVYDVYAVGNVTGRGGVGGIVGSLECDDTNAFLLYKTIYRGDVVDKNWSASGGWAGPVGSNWQDCTARFEQNFYDRDLDPSTNYVVHNSSVQRYTTSQLRSPPSVIGGVFCAPDVVPGRCGDNTWQSSTWTAGNNQQHHVLLNMPGPNAQPR